MTFELRFVVYSLRSFINEFMKMRVGVHEVESGGHFSQENTCAKICGTKRHAEWGAQRIKEHQHGRRTEAQWR